MQDQPPQFLTVGTGAARRRIACILEHGPDRSGPGVVWLPGFKSEMTSTKASAVAAFARERGLPMTRLDYSGHGQSDGRIEDGTIGRWLEEALAVVAGSTGGRQILVGSSMGGYLALLLLRRAQKRAPDLAARIAALLLIAPAWDMTERLMWARFSDRIKQEIEATGVYLRPSAYGDGAYPITRALIEEGRHHLIGAEPFDPGRPVVIIQGLLDPDVPWEHALDLEAHLTGGWVRVVAVPDGEHRLSRPEDIRLLLEELSKLAGAAQGS